MLNEDALKEFIFDCRFLNFLSYKKIKNHYNYCPYLENRNRNGYYNYVEKYPNLFSYGKEKNEKDEQQQYTRKKTKKRSGSACCGGRTAFCLHVYDGICRYQ